VDRNGNGLRPVVERPYVDIRSNGSLGFAVCGQSCEVVTRCSELILRQTGASGDVQSPRSVAKVSVASRLRPGVAT
jgi:hypothetical protein